MKAVYFGYSCSEQTIVDVREALKEHLPVHFYRMSLDSEDSYKLVPVTL